VETGERQTSVTGERQTLERVLDALEKARSHEYARVHFGSLTEGEPQVVRLLAGEVDALVGRFNAVLSAGRRARAQVLANVDILASSLGRIGLGDFDAAIGHGSMGDLDLLRIGIEDMASRLKDANLRLENKIAELHQAQVELKAHRDMLESLSMVDGLTGVDNRRSFDQHLDVAWRQAARDRAPLSIVLVDIDHFKAFNDMYGHLEGGRLSEVRSDGPEVLRRPAKRPGCEIRGRRVRVPPACDSEGRGGGRSREGAVHGPGARAAPCRLLHSLVRYDLRGNRHVYSAFGPRR